MDIVQKGFFEMKFHNVYQSVHTEFFFSFSLLLFGFKIPVVFWKKRLKLTFVPPPPTTTVPKVAAYFIKSCYIQPLSLASALN